MSQTLEINNKLGNLEETKRFLFNKKYDEFTQSLDQPYLFYHGKYERDESNDTKMEFILGNKNKGFVQSVPTKSVRDLLIKFVCKKVDGKVTYDCVVISKTTQPLTELMDVDGFTFNPITKEQVSDYYLNTVEGMLYTDYLH